MAKKTKTPVAAPPPLVIPEARLRAIVRAETDLTSLRRQLKMCEAVQAQRKSEVAAMLRAGGVVEPGAFTATLAQELGACRPAWKDLYLTHMASHGLSEEKATEDARQKYPAKTEEVLVVTEAEHAPAVARPD